MTKSLYTSAICNCVFQRGEHFRAYGSNYDDVVTVIECVTFWPGKDELWIDGYTASFSYDAIFNLEVHSVELVP